MDLQRVGQIHELLARRQVGQAHKVVVSELQKHRRSHPLRALKACCLALEGAEEDALALAAEILAEEPADQLSLSSLAEVYKTLRMPHLMTDLYEKAISFQPDSEEGHKSLFMSYCVERRFDELQALGMKMHSQFGKNYLMWAVGSSLLQAEFSGQELPLVLAERFFEQAIQQGSVTSDEEVRMYVEILRRRRQHDRVMEVLAGELGQKYRLKQERLREAAEACMQAKQYRMANALQVDYLRSQDPDQWCTFTALLESMAHLQQQEEQEEAEGEGAGKAVALSRRQHISLAGLDEGELCAVDYHSQGGGASSSKGGRGGEDGNGLPLVVTLADLLDLVQELRQPSSADRVQASPVGLRGSYLVLMEYRKRMLMGSEDPEVPPLRDDGLFGCASGEEGSLSLRNCLVDYFARFGDKPACFHDMMPYLSQELLERDSQDTEQLPGAEIARLILEELRMKIPEVPDVDSILAMSLSSGKLSVLSRALSFVKVHAQLQFSVEKRSERSPADDYERAIPLAHRAQELAALSKFREDPREHQHGDELMLLAALYLVSAYEKNQDDPTPLVQAAVLLEQANEQSTNFFQFRLLLVRVYVLLGAVSSAHFMYWVSGDVKSLLRESLGYLVLPDCRKYAAVSLLEQHFEKLDKFHQQHFRETPHVGYYPFRHGSFSKVVEMSRFAFNLEMSCQRIHTELDKPLLGLLHQLQTPFQAAEFLSKSIDSHVTGFFTDPAQLDFLGRNLKQNFDVTVLETFDGTGPESLRHLLLPLQEVAPSNEDLIRTLRVKACVQLCLLHATRGLTDVAGRAPPSKKGPAAASTSSPPNAPKPLENGPSSELLATAVQQLKDAVDGALLSGVAEEEWRCSVLLLEACSAVLQLHTSPAQDESGWSGVEAHLSALCSHLDAVCSVHGVALSGWKDFSPCIVASTTKALTTRLPTLSPLLMHHLVWLTLVLPLLNTAAKNMLSASGSGGGGGGGKSGGGKKPKGKRGGKRGGGGNKKKGGQQSSSSGSGSGSGSSSWQQTVLGRVQEHLREVVSMVQRVGESLLWELQSLQMFVHQESLLQVLQSQEQSCRLWGQQQRPSVSSVDRLASGQRRTVAQYIRLISDMLQELRTVL